MRVALPDVNVLVALAWPSHVHHAAATSWFSSTRTGPWATCPITQAGFLRVSANRRVIADARPLAEVASLLHAFANEQDHVFLTDETQLSGINSETLARVQGYRQVTDLHLCLIANSHDAVVVTFDRGLEDLGVADTVTLSL